MPDLQSYLKLMIESGASDLFLTCGATPRIKVDGNTSPVKAPILQRGEVRDLVFPIMSERQKATFDETMEANLSHSFGMTGRFRINVFQQRGEMGVVIRQVRSETHSFQELGLPAACSSLAMLKRGLVLFVGAAGSGKSTSLAAMINYRAANADGHILTIEDPIEFLFRHSRALVDQREISVDTRSFNDALRNAMREAPDVIMIGEIRDHETARHALNYSDTGHLCLSTLHANSADQAVERLASFFPEAARKQVLMELSMNLKAVISQRLLPAVGGGRAALATEMLLSSVHVTDLIREGRLNELKGVMVKGGAGGMHCFDHSLYELHQAGRITLEEALHNADSRTDLSLRIRLSERHTVAEAPNLSMVDLEAKARTQAAEAGRFYPGR
ncbi:MAG: PilT/PilU family type 4a pilus ATPase [Nevskia sp.]|nr:PilT/PilU family type 4a pilus ATPase [Nevskia sp.]